MLFGAVSERGWYWDFAPLYFIRTQDLFSHSHSFQRLNNAGLFSLWHKPSNQKLSAAFLAYSWSKPYSETLAHLSLISALFFGVCFVHIKEGFMFCFIFFLSPLWTDRQPYAANSYILLSPFYITWLLFPLTTVFVLKLWFLIIHYEYTISYE